MDIVSRQSPRILIVPFTPSGWQLELSFRIHSPQAIGADGFAMWIVSEPFRPTSHPGAELRPALSADGRRLAFSGSYEGPQEAYVMPSEGGLPQRLTWRGEGARVWGFTPAGEVLIGTRTASGRPVRAVQVGGPLGAYFPVSLFDTPFDYEAFTAKGGLIGHAGVVVFDDTVDLARQARFAMEFCAIESCGKCTPCRIGSVRGREVIDRILKGIEVDAQIALLEDLCSTMKLGSLCALGGFVPYPVLSALTHFPEDFRARPRSLADVA